MNDGNKSGGNGAVGMMTESSSGNDDAMEHSGNLGRKQKSSGVIEFWKKREQRQLWH
jgi:hypothetical protein